MSRTVTPVLSPGNDLALSVSLTQVDPVTGAESYVTTGTLSGFLSTSNDYLAAAAAGTGTLTCNYSGTNGDWTVTYDAGNSTQQAALATAFASATPYAILTHSSGIRVYVTLEYSAARAAIIIT